MNLLLPLLLLSGLVQGVFAGPKFCKCLYGQSCWPSTDAFKSLTAQLSQPLIQPLPVATPCYASPSKNTTLCSEVQANTANALWRPPIPGAYQNINWEGYISPNGTLSACYLNTTLGVPCGQGSIPPVGVDARTPKDIQVAVKFAKKHNLKIVVKNTGHDFLGRSAGRGAFMIWTRNMKSIKFHDRFVAEGAPRTDKGTPVTLGAGVLWREAYEAAEKQNRFVVGGFSQGGTVGAVGGWLLGGGHSGFAPKFGLGVDNVLEVTLVNAAGNHIVVNKYRNPLLFWALRGGGGGTWGVLTSVTYQTHPVLPFTGARVKVNFSTPEAAHRGISEYIRAHATLSNHAWGGYSYFTPRTLSFSYLAPNLSLSGATASIGPLLDVLKEVGDKDPMIEVSSFGSFFELASFGYAFPAPQGLLQSQVGHQGELSSRLLSRDVALKKANETAQTLLSLGVVSMNYVGGGAVNKPSPHSTSIHPGWRKALAQVYILEVFDGAHTAEAILAAQERLRQKTLILDTITTDSAAYLNEATLHEADFRKAFWGSNYAALRLLKLLVDPTGLFIVPRGVGSEDWDSEVVCRV